MLLGSSVLLLNLSLIQAFLHHLIFHSIDYNHKHLQQITASSSIITVTQIINNPTPNLQSNDPSLLYNRGNSYLTSGEFQKALEDFNQAATLSPTNSDIYISRGIVYEKLLRWDDAIHDYETANSIIKKRPFNRDNAIVYSNLANAETGKLMWKEALRDFTYAASLKSDYEAPRIGKALVQYQLSQKQEAIAYFQLLTSKYPRFADGQAALAVMLYSDKKNVEDALDRWEIALEEDSRYFDVDWVENIRRWPPALVDDLKAFKTMISTKSDEDRYQDSMQL